MVNERKEHLNLNDMTGQTTISDNRESHTIKPALLPCCPYFRHTHLPK